MKKNISVICTALSALASLAVCGAVSVVSASEIIADTAVRGDINSDGELNLFDYIRYQKAACGKINSSSINAFSDLNNDGELNSDDIKILSQYLFGNRKIWTMANLPVMDGSTSAIPLEAGFKSELLGISYTDARNLVNHNKTHESFSRLLSGENDLIFSVPISESQQAEADAAGVHLNMTPVSKESFVFVVSKDNPVDALTQAQIRGIYSGRITNWKEVGGNDEEIIPYQRNSDSGSQNYMIDFMKDDTLADPPLEHVVKTMGGLMDRLAVYENSSASIGYSVYSYAAQMYENSSDVKFIAVDGVKPSRETMADSSYPLVSNTFIMYTDSVSENTREFIDWAVSEEGQQCVIRNGYLPVADIKYPEHLKLYSSSGTGREMPDGYVPSLKTSNVYGSIDADDLSSSEREIITFIKDKELQKQINSEIYDFISAFPEEDRNWRISYEGTNGLISFEIVCDRKWHLITYDLVSGRKAEKFSDLFFKGTDYINEINRTLTRELEQNYAYFLKTDFLGLTGNVDEFTLSYIRVGANSPYLSRTANLFYTSHSLPLYMVTGEYHDMAEYISIFNVDNTTESEISDWDYSVEEDSDGFYYDAVSGSAYHTEAETEKQRDIYRKIYLDAKKAFVSENAFGNSMEKHIVIREYSTYGDKCTVNLLIASPGEWYNAGSERTYDPETGECVTPEDVFGVTSEPIDSFLRISEIDPGAHTVKVRDDSGELIVVEYDPEKADSRFFSVETDSGKGRYYIEDTDFSGRINSHSEMAYSYRFDKDYTDFRIYYDDYNGRHVNIRKKLAWFDGYSFRVFYKCYDAHSEEFYGWVDRDNLTEIKNSAEDCSLNDRLIEAYLKKLSEGSVTMDRYQLTDTNRDGIPELIIAGESQWCLEVYSFSENDGVYMVTSFSPDFPENKEDYSFNDNLRWCWYDDSRTGNYALGIVHPDGTEYVRFVSEDGVLTAEYLTGTEELTLSESQTESWTQGSPKTIINIIECHDRS